MNFKNYVKNIHQKCKQYYLPLGITCGLLGIGLMYDTSDQQREKDLKKSLESLSGMITTHEHNSVTSQQDNAFLYVSYHQLLKDIMDIGLVDSQRNAFYEISEELSNLSSYTAGKSLENTSSKKFSGIMTTEMYTYYMNRVTGLQQKDARHYLHALISAVYLHDHRNDAQKEQFVINTSQQLYDLKQKVDFSTNEESFDETFDKYLNFIKK